MHGLQGLRPEPHDQVTPQPRYAHRNHATGDVGKRMPRRVIARQAVGDIGGKYAGVKVGPRVEPLGQPVELLYRGGIARAPPPVAVVERRAVGLHGVQERGLVVGQGQQIALTRGFDHEFLVHAVHLDAIGELLHPLGRLELQRGHL